MQIFYGVSLTNSIDVTNICLSTLKRNNIIIIPDSDHSRAKLFTDPLPGILKKIIILNNYVMTEYNSHTQITINIENNTIQYIFKVSVDEKIKNIHSKLNIKYGHLYDELPEQKMVVNYITGNEKVLEIGGNIGRNSLVIASLLQDSTNLVTL